MKDTKKTLKKKKKKQNPGIFKIRVILHAKILHYYQTTQ